MRRRLWSVVREPHREDEPDDFEPRDDERVVSLGIVVGDYLYIYSIQPPPAATQDLGRPGGVICGVMAM